MEIEFVGQSLRDPDNTYANTSRLLNCYREPVGDGRYVLKSVLGMRQVTTVGGVFCRAMATIDGVLYIAQGGRLFSVSNAGVVTDLGGIVDSAKTSISGNNGSVTVAAGGNYYLWDGTTLSTPAAGAFSDFGSVTFFGQSTILTEKDGRRIQWSDPATPGTLGGLNFVTAESRDDDILRALPVAGALWAFKDTSIERFAFNGAGDLQAIGGSAFEPGLKAYRLITSVPNGVAFVGSDNKVRLAPNVGVISTTPVETSIKTQSPVAVTYHQDEGHEFVSVIFSDRPTWVYDIATAEWHERAEGQDDPWNVRAIAQAYGCFYACKDNGELSCLERINQDNNSPLIRSATGRTFEAEGEYFTVSRLQAVANVGRNSGTPQIGLKVSRDRGQTFTDRKDRSLGALGKYRTRLIWRALGRQREFTPQLVWSDAVDVNVSATLFVDVA